MVKLHQVNSSDKLLRWIHPGQFHPVEKRPTSAAFKDNEMSVDILCLTTIEESYVRAKKIGKNAVVSISAELVTEKGLEVKHDPVDGNDAHAVILGTKTKSIAKFLATNCEVEIYPSEDEPS